MDQYIAIAADSVATLRRPDVYRVIEWAPADERQVLAKYISASRPDLADEAADCLADLA